MIQEELQHHSNFDVKATTLSVFDDLNQMHHQFGFSDKLTSKAQLKARLDFLQEELNEAYEALDNNNADDFVDAHIDLIVVAVGTLDLSKVNGWKAWDAVHHANMSKKPGDQSKRPEMGMDLVKPPGWIAPCHIGNVGKLPEIMLNDSTYTSSKSKAEKAMSDIRRSAISFLQEAQTTMLKKADDYNFPGSRVKTADYYPRGLDDLEHMLNVKFLRIKSLVDKTKAGVATNFEDIRQNLLDLCVFSALMAEFSEGKMDGQDPNKDLFGREKK